VTDPSRPGFARVYAVELLCREAPSLDRVEILEQMREHCGAVAPLDPAEKAEGLNFHFPQHRVTFKDGSLPAQLVVAVSPKRVDERFLTAALGQTWDWEGAETAVDQHGSTVIVSDLLAAGLPYAERLDLFQDALQAVVECVPSLGLLWRPCGRLVDPDRFLRSHQPGDDCDPLFGPINVRMFRDGEEVAMDTLGLAALGLPDLQCRFSGLDPGRVAGLLHGAARYVYRMGDVIENDHTVPGLEPEERWRCRRADAFIPPARAAIEVLPEAR
jgi:hypothetical protein